MGQPSAAWTNDPDRPLTPKEALFVEGYFLHAGNKLEAAKHAGAGGKHAKGRGYEFSKRANVERAIAERQATLSAKHDITIDRVAEELAVIGFADMRHYLKFDAEGQVILDWSEMPEVATRAIQEVTQERYVEGNGDKARAVLRTKFRLHPKTTALDQLGKYLGMFSRDKVTFPVDPSTLTDDQLRQIAAGADPWEVLAGARGVR